MKPTSERAAQVFWWVYIHCESGGAVIRAASQELATEIARKYPEVQIDKCEAESSHISIRGVLRKLFGLQGDPKSRDKQVAFEGNPFRLLTASGYTIVDEVTDRPKHYKPRYRQPA